ncbi:hypothetical protein TRVL_05833 [Trypanosoma vivax]|nr:hypothetical protein TRVL_05833 [Trypanosoma vivax]
MRFTVERQRVELRENCCSSSFSKVCHHSRFSHFSSAHKWSKFEDGRHLTNTKRSYLRLYFHPATAQNQRPKRPFITLSVRQLIWLRFQTTPGACCSQLPPSYATPHPPVCHNCTCDWRDKTFSALDLY